ncbi:hypothetical protein MAR_003663 [Mya arenaria]|uniref:Uncharacterized protein n=1 Tax=Mya arenaria TaxID=6604 RepID=A0ABY7G6R2_MYAAR|nr:hypothetical protein MAR_003663 [Mya arenaria]
MAAAATTAISTEPLAKSTPTCKSTTAKRQTAPTGSAHIPYGASIKATGTKKGQNGRTGYVTEPMYPVTQPPTPPPRRRNNRRRFRNPPQRRGRRRRPPEYNEEIPAFLQRDPDEHKF